MNDDVTWFLADDAQPVVPDVPVKRWPAVGDEVTVTLDYNEVEYRFPAVVQSILSPLMPHPYRLQVGCWLTWNGRLVPRPVLAADFVYWASRDQLGPAGEVPDAGPAPWRNRAH